MCCVAKFTSSLAQNYKLVDDCGALCPPELIEIVQWNKYEL